MAAKIIWVGGGALGSWGILFSRGLDAEHTVIDFDRIERKNVLSQFHTKMGVGKNKAKALQQVMQGMFGVRLNAIPHKLTSDNVNTLLKGADIVVDCVDNAEARKLIQDYVRANNIPCLHGALAADGAFGRVMWDEIFSIDAGGEGQATCEDGEHLPFITSVSADIAQVLKDFLDNGKKRSFQRYPGGIFPLT